MVPSLMAVFGEYNWWLPNRVARFAGSPLVPPR
jgi:uncharacterized membrane protein YdfJ with MMPL/SSD domain